MALDKNNYIIGGLKRWSERLFDDLIDEVNGITSSRNFATIEKTITLSLTDQWITLDVPSVDHVYRVTASLKRNNNGVVAMKSSTRLSQRWGGVVTSSNHEIIGTLEAEMTSVSLHSTLNSVVVGVKTLNPAIVGRDVTVVLGWVKLN